MTTPLTTINPNDQLYAYMLANRFRSPWVYSPSGAELSEPDIWDTMLRDSDIAGSRQRRNQNIVRPWRIVPSPHANSKYLKTKDADASKRVAAIIQEAFEYIDGFDSSRFILADAFFLGRRYAEVVYEEMTVSLDGTPPKPWFIPIKLKDVDRRRFRWVPVWDKAGKKKTGIELHLFDTNEFAWHKLGDDERRRYVEYIPEDTEDQIGFGRRALEAGFMTHYFKSTSTKRYLEAIDSLANGWMTAKLDSLRAADPTLTNEELVTKTLAAMEKMRSNHKFVLGEGDKIELVEISGAGQAVIMEGIRYWAESFDRLANGTPPGKSKTALDTGAAQKEKSDEEETYYQFPRETQDATLQRDLLGGFMYFNAHNLESLGLADAKRAKFTSAQIKKQDPVVAVEVMNAMLDHGQPILRSEYYDAAEKTPPGPDDDVIEGANIGMAGMGIDDQDGFPKEKPPPRDPNKRLPAAKMSAEEDFAKFDARLEGIERLLQSAITQTPTEKLSGSDEKMASAMQRFLGKMEAFFSWFMGRQTPEKKNA